MTKKRVLAIALSSPLLLVILALMLLSSCVGYAVSGKWELKAMIKAWSR